MRLLLIINDHNKIEEVFKKSSEYLKNRESMHDEIADHLWAYNEIGTLVPQTLDNFWSGHFFPFAESYYELENSFEFCGQGFYRHSLFALRCVLELAIIGLYFDKEDQAHIDIQQWFHSKDPTPYFSSTLKALFKLEPFKQFDERLHLQSDIERIYFELSDYVHIRGYQYSNTGQSRSNFNQFNEQAYNHYVQLMKKIVKNIITMMLLKYPVGMQSLPLWEKFGLNSPVGGMLDESSQNAVFRVLDENVKKQLQEISDNDPISKTIVESIMRMPDLTDKENKKQNEEWEEEIEKHRFPRSDIS